MVDFLNSIVVLADHHPLPFLLGWLMIGITILQIITATDDVDPDIVFGLCVVIAWPVYLLLSIVGGIVQLIRSIRSFVRVTLKKPT